MTTLRQCHDKNIWNDYILENRGHPLQLWGWGDLKAANNWRVYRLFLYDEEDNILGAAQMLIHRLPLPLATLAYVPRGPVVSESNREMLLNKLSTYAKKTCHSIVLTIEPDSVDYDLPPEWHKSNNRILPSSTTLLDLKKSESELLAAMPAKTRQYIRKSAAEKIQIKRIRDRGELAKILEVYHQTAKRANFSIHKNDYYYDVFSFLDDHSPVFAAYHEGEPIAFLWLAISAETAFELYGGMTDTGKQLRANYALKWHVIRKCKEWDINRYDFGGLIGGGVSNFKMNWTDSETHFAGTFDKPLSPLYHVYKKGLPTVKKTVQKIRALFKR